MTKEEKQKAIDALKISVPVMGVTNEEFIDYKQTLNKIMDWLEQESTTKNGLGSDCISRTEAIERLKLNFPISEGADNSRDRHRYMQALADLQAIKELRPITPQDPNVVPIAEIKFDKDELKELVNEAVLRIRPKGHWINKQHLFDYCSAECSSCHERSNGYVHDNGFSLEHKYYDFCPNCGSDNREVEDGR